MKASLPGKRGLHILRSLTPERRKMPVNMSKRLMNRSISFTTGYEPLFFYFFLFFLAVLLFFAYL
jgi:hypothetical protein